MKILLVEDDIDLVGNIIDYLEIHNCHVDHSETGEKALEMLHKNDYDAMVLDINLPGIDGFEVCRRVRTEMYLKMPIVMLTARIMLVDKLEGFKSGTDDFLPKPFDLSELKMRLFALHRRVHQGMAIQFCVDDLYVDPENGTVIRDGDHIKLPPICFTILLKLMESYPGIVTKEELEAAIWANHPPMTDALKVHFFTLRQKVDKPYDKQLLYNIRGRGYTISTKGNII
ncbi:two component transcriptional regulator, winged helix family [Denitrovibrio acetiphilus DSM 12809]|uniref:Two component transcriptional regulator, winged helix family n=1 Tax=Denitrovibrio acetiphilus (strain DSM 12809 / NBRC 114555 / N2460) TaxID=522772 RepID=D4H516_DENA2|nr:response regulator transcription factor [Denitrovibrio acetiphilus]ADD69372.1 two component transcriptional regulator, winged helix family [Denitrovibrio acetiphilus DSM 12809]